MLNIQHLTKTYGDKKAVDDLSLHIRPGEVYGFIGHNGAGKTTTLKAVAGILPFDAGEITIGGVSVREDPLACKRQLAYIPDNPDLYDFMTGESPPTCAGPASTAMPPISRSPPPCLSPSPPIPTG